MMGRRPSARALFKGIAQIAVFNPAGLSAIGGTVEAYLASLAPLIALVLVSGLIMGASTGWRAGLGYLLQGLCVQLAQPVISHQLAVWSRREDRWLRFATAQNWCQLILPAVLLPLLAAAAALGGLTLEAGFAAIATAVVLYGLALNWFLAARALELGWLRGLGFLAGYVLACAAVLTLLFAIGGTGTALPVPVPGLKA